MNDQKTYNDWVYGKIQGMLEALKCQGVITEDVYNSLGDLIHQTDRYREWLEREIKARLQTPDKGSNNE